jgi:hypothetical protein
MMNKNGSSLPASVDDVVEIITSTGRRVSCACNIPIERKREVEQLLAKGGRAYKQVGEAWFSLDGKTFTRASVFLKRMISKDMPYHYYVVRFRMVDDVKSAVNGKTKTKRVDCLGRILEEALEKAAAKLAGEGVNGVSQKFSVRRYINLTGQRLALRSGTGNIMFIGASNAKFDAFFKRCDVSTEKLTLYVENGSPLQPRTRFETADLEVKRKFLVPTDLGKEVLEDAGTVIFLSLPDYLLFLASPIGKEERKARVIGCFYGQNVGLDAFGLPIGMIVEGIDLG